jgi:hypothetical protein
MPVVVLSDGGRMHDHRLHEAQSNGPIDHLAAVGLLLAILLLVAAVVVYLT